MIKTEQVTIGNFTYTRTYSDANRYVIRDGVEYEEALDSVDSGYIYFEGGLIPVDLEAEESRLIETFLNDGTISLSQSDQEEDYFNEEEEEQDYFI